MSLNWPHTAGAVLTEDSLLETERLWLTQWQPADREAFYRLNSDSRVMQYFPAALDLAGSDLLLEKIKRHFIVEGFGLYALRLKAADGTLIGFCGLSRVSFEAGFYGEVEAGWRLSAQYWRQGLAEEAARSVIEYAFNSIELKRLVSFTSELNLPSLGLMNKLGFRFVKVFEHPNINRQHPFCRHHLYELTA